MAELYGKVEGCSHGYGGSMHLYDVERGNLGANAVVGGGLPAIIGAAPRVPAPQRAARRARVLRRRRDEHRHLPRGDEPRAALAAYRPSSSARTTTGPSRRPRRSTRRSSDLVAACAGVRHAFDQGRRPGRRGRVDKAREALEHARCGEGPGLPLVETFACTGTTSAIRRCTATRTSSRRHERMDPIDKLRDNARAVGERSGAPRRRVLKVSRSRRFAKARHRSRRRKTPLKNIYA